MDRETEPGNPLEVSGDATPPGSPCARNPLPRGNPLLETGANLRQMEAAARYFLFYPVVEAKEELRRWAEDVLAGMCAAPDPPRPGATGQVEEAMRLFLESFSTEEHDSLIHSWVSTLNWMPDPEYANLDLVAWHDEQFAVIRGDLQRIRDLVQRAVRTGRETLELGYEIEAGLLPGKWHVILDHLRQRILDHRSTALAAGDDAGRKGERCARWTTTPAFGNCIGKG